MEKRTKNGPLLYISQPFSSSPAHNMQEVYTTRQEVQLPVEEPIQQEESSRKKVIEVSLLKKEQINNETKTPELVQEIKTPEKKELRRSSFSRLKGFKEMNLNERLEYLINYPKALPPVPCVFSTENKKVQGYLVQYNDSELEIRLPDETTEKVSRIELNDIIMIGLKG